MVQLYEAYLQARQAPDNCYLCRELGADLQCICCDRLFHPLCLHHPAISAAELPGGAWACPCCGEDQEVCVFAFVCGRAGEGTFGGNGGACGCHPCTAAAPCMPQPRVPGALGWPCTLNRHAAALRRWVRRAGRARAGRGPPPRRSAWA
jgi:hypothetical protein